MRPPVTDWQATLTGELLVFTLLSRVLYRYPEQAERTLIQSLTEDDFFNNVPFGSEREETRAGLVLLQKWAEGGLDDDVFASLQADYTRLFIGIGKLKTAPWGSVYLSKEHILFQKETLEVRDWYRRFGLEPEKKYTEPDDHIGLELGFIAHLASLSLQALEAHDKPGFENTLKAQYDFIAQHPLRWAPLWAESVQKHARTDYYRGLSFLVIGALQAALEKLRLEITEEQA